MRIALAAMPVIDRDIKHNLQVIVDTVSRLSGQADLVLFGEAVLQGFDSLTWEYEQDCRMAVTRDAPVIETVRSAAREAGVAVSFGYLEKIGESIFSSQMVIDADGEIVHNFHRVSPGWKEPIADRHYVEGAGFVPFTHQGKRLAIGLCGDLWTPQRPEEMRALDVDAVLWPVYCDYNPEEWNTKIKYEYAKQAGLCGRTVLLVNPVCLSPNSGGNDLAAGGAVCFQDGTIFDERPAGGEGILLVEL